MALLALPGLVLLAIFFIAVRVESRRFGLGLLLSLALLELGGVALGTALPVLAATTSGEVGTWALLGVFFLLVAGIAVLGAFLIVNAFTMLRKEGFGLSTLLSAGLGVAVLAYLTGAVLVLMSDRTDWFVWLAVLGLPAAYVAFLLDFSGSRNGFHYGDGINFSGFHLFPFVFFTQYSCFGQHH